MPLKDTFSRFGPLPALLALIILAYFVQLARGITPEGLMPGLLGMIIYLFWGATLLTYLSVYLDVKLFWRKHSYASTYLISLISGLAIFVGRVLMLFINIFYTAPYSLNLLIRPPYADVSIIISIGTMITGISLALVTTTLHSVPGRPLIFSEAMSLEEWFRVFKAEVRSR